MIGLVMAGGRGTRMNLDGEKLLLLYKKPVIIHVIDALKESKSFTEIFAITSPHTPQTRKLLEQNDIKVMESAGDGYVQDLYIVLNKIDDAVFVTSGDLPLLDSDMVKKITNLYKPEHTWTSIMLTKKFSDSFGVSDTFENQQYCYSGISLINAKNISSLQEVTEHRIIIDDKRIALNLNTRDDYNLLGTA